MVRALAFHQCVPGSIPGPGVICGLSLLLVLFLAPRGFFPGTPVFPLSSKTNISKFQFDLDYCQALYHEPLTRVIARALPVFDVKFTFIYLFYAPSCTFINLHTPSCTFIHIHTHCRHRSLLVRTTFPDPSCEDTLLHSSYPNHTWVFISLPVGLSNHLIEI